jgi:hypothetical protein
MPNPTDFERLGGTTERSTKLIQSAGPTASTRPSWSEWFGATSNTWLGSAGTGYVTDLGVGGARTGIFWAGTQLVRAVVPGGGFFAMVVESNVGGVALDVIGKKLEDVAKALLPDAIEAGRESFGGRYYGGNTNPGVVLNRPITDKTLEDTINLIKQNSALIQDLLNKVAGKAGKAHFCDDVYQISVLAQKLELTKSEVKRDTALLRLFLEQLEKDVDLIDSSDISEKVKALSVAICDAGDGRHWDNTWHTSTIGRASHCSKQHCFGPRA